MPRTIRNVLLFLWLEACSSGKPPADRSCVAAQIANDHNMTNLLPHLPARLLTQYHEHFALQEHKSRIPSCQIHLMDPNVLKEHFGQPIHGDLVTNGTVTFITAGHCLAPNRIPQLSMVFSWKGETHQVHLEPLLSRLERWAQSKKNLATWEASAVELGTLDSYTMLDVEWELKPGFATEMAERVHQTKLEDRQSKRDVFSAADGILVQLSINTQKTEKTTLRALDEAIKYHGKLWQKSLVQSTQKAKTDWKAVYRSWSVSRYKVHSVFSQYSYFLLENCSNPESEFEWTRQGAFCLNHKEKRELLRQFFPEIKDRLTQKQVAETIEILYEDVNTGWHSAFSSMKSKPLHSFVLYSYSGNGLVNFSGFSFKSILKDDTAPQFSFARIQVDQGGFKSKVEFDKGDSGALLSENGSFPLGVLLRADGENSSGGFPLQFLPSPRKLIQDSISKPKKSDPEKKTLDQNPNGNQDTSKKPKTLGEDTEKGDTKSNENQMDSDQNESNRAKIADSGSQEASESNAGCY